MPRPKKMGKPIGQNIVKQKKERKNLAKVDNAEIWPNNTILHTECNTEWLTLQCPRMVHCAVSTPELLPTLCYDPSQGRHLIWELKRNKINSLCLWLDGAGDGSPWYLPGSVPVCSLGHTLRIITHTSDTTFQLQIPRTHNRVYIGDCTSFHIFTYTAGAGLFNFLSIYFILFFINFSFPHLFPYKI